MSVDPNTVNQTTNENVTTAHNTADDRSFSVPSTSDDSGAGIVVSGPYPVFPDHDEPNSGS
jgi:hypothetical protein